MSIEKDSINSTEEISKLPIRTDLFEALIDNADHSISIAEREGEDTILIYVNQAFEKMTGYIAEEYL